MFQTKAVEKIKTHILCSLTFFSFFENRAFYEIVWKNIVKRGGPTIIIWRTRVACRISKAKTHTHSGCVILSPFPLQQWVHERATILRYTYIACIVLCWRCMLFVFRPLSVTWRACNFLTVTATVLQSMLPKPVNTSTSIVSNILNVFVASNFGILPSCPSHLLWTSGHQGWYLYFISYLSYLCLIQVSYFIWLLSSCHLLSLLCYTYTVYIYINIYLYIYYVGINARSSSVRTTKPTL